MTNFLPDPRMRCSAYWYALRGGMITGDDSEFLRDLGARAAKLGRWYGYAAWLVPEGPFWVYMWPEHVWDETASAMADEAAEFGYWEAGDYT